MTTAAAWVVALAAWAGALAGLPSRAAAWSPASWPPVAGAGLVLLGAGVAAAGARLADRDALVDATGRPARPARLVVVAVAVALAVAGAAGARAAVAEGSVLAGLAEEPVGTATVEATAMTDLRGADGGWQVVRVDRVAGRRVRERAWWRLDADQAAAAPTVGERVRARVRLSALGPDGLDAHAARLHAVARLRPLRAPRLVDEPGWLLAATEHVRTRTAEAAHRGLDERRAGVLAALVTGDRRSHAGSGTLREEFADAGLAHLVVVSGKHVALVLGGTMTAAALAGLGARRRRVVALAALAWFVVLTRWQPSVLRAGAMGALVLAAGIGGRGVDPRHALAAAVTLLLLADPFLAGQVGFGLSVGATAGVLVLAPWLSERVPAPRWLAAPAAVTIGAQLGAAPLLLTLDGIGLASIPANLVAVPAAVAAQALGLAAALVAQLSVAAAGGVAALAGPPLAVIVWAAETFSAGPRLTADELASPSLWIAVALIAAAAAARARWPRAPSPAAVTAAVVVVALAPLPSRPPADVTHLTATFFDVGQGLAVLVEVPDGDTTARLLYDAGPHGPRTVGHLEDRRIDELDALALSHPHHDHAGGMAAVLEAVDVDRLIVGPDEPHPGLTDSVHEAYAAARQEAVPTVPVHTGQRFPLGEAHVRVLSPPDDRALGTAPNQRSVVLAVTSPDGRLLLTGDVEEPNQQRLLRRRRQQLPAAVLQVAHHGGDTNADGFHDTVGAAVGVIGVGDDNSFGHPHPRVLARLRAVGTDVYRTDRHGTVTVTLADGRAHAEAER